MTPEASRAPEAAPAPSGTLIRIVGIETSCDETAIGLVENGRRVLSNTIASSLALHAPFGGVIPEIAARAHVETIWDVLAESLGEAGMTPEQVDAVAVTQGPGLPGALLIGLAFAKGLALALERPLVPVDHLAAHLYAGQMSEPSLQRPYIGLIVSGGHTVLCVAHEECRYEVLGETRDDAVGEAFDKVAKLLGLGYPGGPAIDRLSEEGRSGSIQFPRSHTKQPFDFSFSGLKTAVYQYVERQRGAGREGQGVRGRRQRAEAASPETPETGVVPEAQAASAAGAASSAATGLEASTVAEIAASFQEAAVEVLVTKTLRACQRTGIKRVVVGGGVAANRRLRARFAELAATHKLQVVFPPPSLCLDNGAMVAGIGYALLQRGRIAALSLRSEPNLCLA